MEYTAQGHHCESGGDASLARSSGFAPSALARFGSSEEEQPRLLNHTARAASLDTPRWHVGIST